MPLYPEFVELIKRRAGDAQPMRSRLASESLEACIKRQIEPDDFEHGWVSLSQLGSCARKLKFRKDKTEPDGREIYWRTRFTWMNGDLIEFILSSMLVEALYCYMPEWTLTHWRHKDQKRVTMAVGETEIPGYSDGVLCEDGDTPRIIWSVKSQSSYGFKLWRNQGGPTKDDSEWWQAQGEMAAHGLDHLYLCSLCKDSGQLAGYWLTPSANFPMLIQLHLGLLNNKCLPNGRWLEPEPSLTPAKRQPKKDHMKLPWQCCYCPYYRTCWGEDLVDPDKTIEDGYKGPAQKLYVLDPEYPSHPVKCPCWTCKEKYER